MSGDSLWVLLIILLVVAIPVAPFLIFRKAEIDHLNSWLTRFFYTAIGSFVGLIVAATVEETVVAFVLVAVFTIANWAYLAVLALLARRLGSSPILWWGVPLIFSPFGFIASYPMMLRKIRTSRSDRNSTDG